MKPQLLTWREAEGPYMVQCNQHLMWPGVFRETGRDIVAHHKTLFGDRPGPLIGNGYDRLLLNHPGDLRDGHWSPRFDYGVAELRVEFGGLLDLFRASNARISQYVGDGESGRSFWNLSAENLRSLDTDPAYQSLCYEMPDLPREPSKIEWQGWNPAVVEFNNGLSVACDRARKAAFVDVLAAKMPGVLMHDYGAVLWSKEHAHLVPDPNGWPSWTYDTPMTALAPVIYGTLGNQALINPLYGRPFNMTKWQVNYLLETLRGANGRPMYPWVGVPKESNVFAQHGRVGTLYWQAMVRCALVLAGAQLLYFNFSDTSPEQDALISGLCAEYEAHARGRTSGRALLLDGGRSPQKPFINMSNTAFAVTWRFDDGSTLSYAVLAPGAKPTTLSIDGKAVKVAAEDGVGCWRGVG